MTVARVLPAALSLLLLCGCGGGERGPVPTATVGVGAFEMRIRAEGELQAASSTSLDLPRALSGRQRIAWLAVAGARVGEGDVVCELDPENIDREIEARRRNIAKLDFQIEAKRAELANQRHQLEGEVALLEHERADAVATAPRDESIFSRHEIIENEIDLELIDARLGHAAEQLRRATGKEATEIEILESQRRTELGRLDELLDARGKLVVRAPHDGIFLPGRTWQGETYRVGMEIFGGGNIGVLPDLSAMEALVHVLEAEAAGLAPGLAAELTLDAYPGFVATGTVKQVQPVANPLDRQSPVKYFDVVLSLDETDTERMRPGAQVGATIFVKREEQALTIPNQAIFVEGGEPWVYVRSGGSFERRAVELGERSLSRTIVGAGLEAGDVVALVQPQGPRLRDATGRGDATEVAGVAGDPADAPPAAGRR